MGQFAIDDWHIKGGKGEIQWLTILPYSNPKRELHIDVITIIRQNTHGWS
jgi:hypothetical protein